MIVTNVRLSLLLPQGTNSSEPEIRGTEETPGTFRRGSGGYDVACGLSYCRPVPWNRRVRCSDNNSKHIARLASVDCVDNVRVIAALYAVDLRPAGVRLWTTAVREHSSRHFQLNVD